MGFNLRAHNLTERVVYTRRIISRGALQSGKEGEDCSYAAGGGGCGFCASVGLAGSLGYVIGLLRPGLIRRPEQQCSIVDGISCEVS